MGHIGQESKNISKAANTLDSVSLNHAEREIAKAHMENAELFADRVILAGAGVRSVFLAFGHGCGVLAHRVRMAFGKLAHH